MISRLAAARAALKFKMQTVTFEAEKETETAG
jgi:hypothetical protein